MNLNELTKEEFYDEIWLLCWSEENPNKIPPSKEQFIWMLETFDISFEDLCSKE